MQPSQPLHHPPHRLHIPNSLPQPLDNLLLHRRRQIQKRIHQLPVYEPERLLRLPRLVPECAVAVERDVAGGADEVGEGGLQAHEGVEVGGGDEADEVDGAFDLRGGEGLVEVGEMGGRKRGLTVPMKAVGVTIAFGLADTSKLRMRFTISPSLISLMTSSRRRSSAVMPLVFCCKTIRLPPASLSRNAASFPTCATAVAHTVWKWRATSSSVSGRPVVPRLYSTMETLFMRSATAIILPVMAMSMGAVEVRKLACFCRVLSDRE